MMLRTIIVVAGVSCLCACGPDDPARKAADDARDVAMVKRMSKEPFNPIIPKPITRIDIERYGLDKPGCAFTKDGAAVPVFIANADEGFMHIDADLKRFAAKTQSAELPGGARATYVGLASWVDLISLPDTVGGGDPNAFPARLILHDAQERVAFMADGQLACHE